MRRQWRGVLGAPWEGWAPEGQWANGDDVVCEEWWECLSQTSKIRRRKPSVRKVLSVSAGNGHVDGVAWRDAVGEQPCIALSCDGMACTAQCLYSLFGAPGRSRSLRAGHKKGPGLLHLGIELPHPGASETARIHDSAHARFHMNKRNPVVGWPLGLLVIWPLGHLAVWLCQFNTYAQRLSHRR